jgi:hypothetical protein
MAIIRNKTAQLGLTLDDEVVDYIAENITANIRQIEGVVKRLTAYKDIMDDSISIGSVKRAIKDVIRVGTYIPTPYVIIEETPVTTEDRGGSPGPARSAKHGRPGDLHVPLPEAHETLLRTSASSTRRAILSRPVLTSIRKIGPFSRQSGIAAHRAGYHKQHHRRTETPPHPDVACGKIVVENFPSLFCKRPLSVTRLSLHIFLHIKKSCPGRARAAFPHLFSLLL